MALSLVQTDDSGLFRRCLLGSAAFHALLLLLGGLGATYQALRPAEGIIIDLSLPLRGVDSAAPGPVELGPTAPPLAAPVPAAVEAAESAAPEPVVFSEPEPDPVPVAAAEAEAMPLPAPTAAFEASPINDAPAAGDASAQASPQGLEGGEGTTPGYPAVGPEGGGGTGPAGRSASPEIMPSLLNRDEVLKNLRRFYPESERLAGREAQVVVKIVIGVSGKVEGVDVLRSAGTAFDDGAKAVARRMRFSPAILGGKPTAVAVPQLIVFELR